MPSAVRSATPLVKSPAWSITALLPLPSPLIVPASRSLVIVTLSVAALSVVTVLSYWSCAVTVQAPATGFLVVLSEPPGASIEVDGLARGSVTPDTLELTVGEHTVRVLLDEHESLPAQSEIDIEEGRRVSAEFCLSLTGDAPVPRIVLVEHFGNIRCEPCGPAEILIRDFQESLGHAQLLTIGYRTNWPASQDPVYVENPAVHSDRISFYSVTVAPTLVFDGGSSMNVPTDRSSRAAL